jgi:hypothetical protein
VVRTELRDLSNYFFLPVGKYSFVRLGHL